MVQYPTLCDCAGVRDKAFTSVHLPPATPWCACPSPCHSEIYALSPLRDEDNSQGGWSQGVGTTCAGLGEARSLGHHRLPWLAFNTTSPRRGPCGRPKRMRVLGCAECLQQSWRWCPNNSHADFACNCEANKQLRVYRPCRRQLTVPATAHSHK